MTRSPSHLAPCLAAAFAAIALTAAPRAQAGQVLLTSDNNGSGYYDNVYTVYPAAQQFTLTQSATITDVSAELETGTLGGLSMKIVSDSAGSPGATTYGTSTSATGSLNNSTFAPIDFAFSTPVTLGPGTYWTELTGTTYWEYQNYGYTNSSSYGSINNTYYTIGTSYSHTPFLVSLIGSAAVPEPSSLILTGSALAIAGFVAARRRMAQA